MKDWAKISNLKNSTILLENECEESIVTGGHYKGINIM